MPPLVVVPARWQQREVDVQQMSALQTGQGLSAPVARALSARGVVAATVDSYLSPRLSALPEPMALAGMDAALERLLAAIVRGETIGVFGDYDVDGVTSSTLLAEFLEAVGAPVSCTIPDRLIEGYGMSVAGVDRLAAAGCTLLVTVDCGITNHDEVRYARSKDIDVIVIDHHTVPVQLPAAVAVINPHRIDCHRGSTMLCAVGVTFNLVAALRRALRERGHFSSTRPEPDMRDMLDLVALGTVADVVPLVGENRILVAGGLHRLRQASRPGLQALLQVAGVDPTRLDAGDLGFQLGPRVNAAGRLGDAMVAVTLLRAKTAAEAQPLARRLDEENAARRALEADIVRAAIHQVEQSAALRTAAAIVVADDAWHPGVVGIVAARLVERFGRPAVVVGQGGRGSGRSVDKFSLYDALKNVEGELQGFGGHAHAAGLRVAADRVGSFRDAFLAYAEQSLTAEARQRVALHDGELAATDVSLELCRELQRAAPFGRHNPEPTFVLRNQILRGQRILSDKHIKAFIERPGAPPLDVIAFGAAERGPVPGGPVDLLAVPEINVFRDTARVQLRVRDLRPSP
jgi:single-stranded-DNA-specific exonuclease